MVDDATRCWEYCCFRSLPLGGFGDVREWHYNTFLSCRSGLFWGVHVCVVLALMIAWVV